LFKKEKTIFINGLLKRSNNFHCTIVLGFIEVPMIFKYTKMIV